MRWIYVTGSEAKGLFRGEGFGGDEQMGEEEEKGKEKRQGWESAIRYKVSVW